MLEKSILLIECLLAFSFCASSLCAESLDEPKSNEASALLDKVQQCLAQIPKAKSDERRSVKQQLVQLRIANGQYEKAEEMLDGIDEWTAKQSLARICELRIANLARSVVKNETSSANESEQIQEIKRLNLARGEYRITRHVQSIELLIQHGRIDLAEEIIDSNPGDMDRFQFEPGSYGNGFFKMSNLAKIAEFHFRNGDESSAEKILDRFGDPKTRDLVRTGVIANCLLASKENVDVAEAVFKQLEGNAGKYRGGYLLSSFFACQRNWHKNSVYAEAMLENVEDSEPGDRPFESGPVLAAAHHAFESGGDCQRWLDLAEKLVSKGHQRYLEIVCVKALVGDTKELHDFPDIVPDVIPLLLVQESKKKTNRVQPLQLIDENRRLETANEIANAVEDPLIQALALCLIADFLSNDKIDKARKIIDQALDTARQAKGPARTRWNTQLEREDVFQHIAVRYSKIGEYSKAMDAVSEIASEPARKRQQAIANMSKCIGSNDLPFKVAGAPSVFQLLKDLETFDVTSASLVLDQVTRKFIELDNWSAAENAFQQLNSKFENALTIPFSVTQQIAKTEDQKRLRHWFELCDDSEKRSFLDRFCNVCIYQSKIPSPQTVVQVEQLESECSRGSKAHFDNVDRFLIFGLWADGFEEKASERIDRIRSDQQSEKLLKHLARKAMAADLPELAVVIGGRSDEGAPEAEKAVPDLLTPQFFSSTERVSKLIQNKPWMDKQPILVQIKLMLSRVRHILGTG